MESVLTDSKYQTLANEYSKVTAKCSILKKAVIDEQAKNSSLKSELHETERQLRLQHQECEALSFRNQQLVRRVELLQSELDERDNSSGTTGGVQSRARRKLERFRASSASPSPAGCSPSPDISVLQEELQQKIEENVRLNRRLEETQAEHTEALGALTSRLKQAEARLKPSSTGLATTPATLTNTATPARHPSGESTYSCTDSTTVDVKSVSTYVRSVSGSVSPAPSVTTTAAAGSTLADVEQLQAEARLRDQQMAVVKRQLATARAKLSYFVLLDDSECASLCALNVPVITRSACCRAAMHCSRLSSSLCQLLTALADWLTATEQRLTLLTQRQQLGINNVSKSLRELLQQRSVVLTSVEQAMTSVTTGVSDMTRPLSLSTLPELCRLHSAIVSLHVFLQRFTGQLKLSIQEDDTFSRSSAHLYAAAVTSLTCAVGRLAWILNTLCLFTRNPRASPGAVDQTVCNQSAVSRLMPAISSVLDDLHHTLLTSCDVYSSHVDSDIDNSNLDLIRLERHLVSNLQTAATCAESLCQQWRQSADWLSACSPARVRGYHVLPRRLEVSGGQQEDEANEEFRLWSRTPALSPSVTALMQRNVAYINSTAQPLFSRAELSTVIGPSSSSLCHQLAGEHQDEEPMSAAHVKQLEEQLLTQEHQLQQIQLEHSLLQLKIQEQREESTADGDDKAKRSLSCYDRRVQAHVQSQLKELVEREQLVASRCRHYQLECRSMSRQLTAAEDTCRSLRESADHLKHAQQQTVEELAATRSSYDSQLATMSDHLATLNRTMTQQRDEIDHLRYQKSQLMRSANIR